VKTAETTVLVIDDVAENCELLKHRLEKHGYNVEMAIDGLEGLLILSRRVIDLVLLDLDMPVMNGFTFLEKIKANKKFSHIPVVITSSIDDEDTANDCISFGAEKYIYKPFEMEEVLSSIKACLAV
jgi:CheY-like chemotaxis protein